MIGLVILVEVGARREDLIFSLAGIVFRRSSFGRQLRSSLGPEISGSLSQCTVLTSEFDALYCCDPSRAQNKGNSCFFELYYCWLMEFDLNKGGKLIPIEHSKYQPRRRSASFGMDQKSTRFSIQLARQPCPASSCASIVYLFFDSPVL